MKYSVWGAGLGSVMSDDNYDLVNLVMVRNDVDKSSIETFDKVSAVVWNVFNNIEKLRDVLGMATTYLELDSSNLETPATDKTANDELVEWINELDKLLIEVQTCRLDPAPEPTTEPEEPELPQAERDDFRDYCRTLTTAQVEGVIEREARGSSKAHRACKAIAEEELARRQK